MKKEEFELVKKAFGANKAAMVLYFTAGGKSHTDADKAKEAGKELGYKIVYRSQLDAIEESLKLEVKSEETSN